MKKKYSLMFLLFTCIIACTSSCNDDQLLDNATFETGKKAILHLSVTTPDMEVKTRVGLPPDREKEISSILVYIFDENKKLISLIMHESMTADTGGTALKPDGSNALEIETLTGNNRTIYAVANYYNNALEGFKDVITESDLNKLIVEVYGNLIFREYGMMKVGKKTDVNIRENSAITLDLRYVSAKVTVNVVNNDPNFMINGWTVNAIAKKSYLVERAVQTGLNADPNYHDASDINNDYDFSNDFATASFPFENGNGTNASPYTATFYLLENRRGGPVTKADPPGGLAQYAGKEYMLKSWYAPKNATSLTVLGYNAGESKSIAINYHLGKNVKDNYDIERGIHYIVNYQINSWNNININTNISTNDITVPIRLPANLTNLDAHPSSRKFTIYTNMITDEKTKVHIEVLQALNSSLPPNWLKLAAFPTSSFHVRSGDPVINQWQQPANEHSYVRPMFIPHKSERSSVGYTHPVNGITLQGGASEKPNLTGKDPNNYYPNNDDELPYNFALHRMCNKITNLPTYDVPIDIYLYANEYPATSSTLYREAIVRITYDNGIGEPEYFNYQVRQYSPIKYIDLPSRSDGKTLYVERNAEFNSITDGSIPIDKQLLGGMQWGPYNNGANDPANGYNNTLLGVYKNNYAGVMTAANWLPKYGSYTGGWNAANNGLIKEDASIRTEGAPSFSLPLNTENGYHAILNSTAARYCHEKNRDINGDGEIDASETHWYLPSMQEMQLIWTLHEMLDMQNEFYWTSTEADATHAYAFAMRNLPNDSKYRYDGLSQKMPKTHSLNSNPPRVRCVRRDTGQPILPNIYTSVNGAVVLDCITLPGSVYTAASKNSTTQNATSQAHAANQKVYRRFEISPKQDVAASYFELYENTGKCDINEGWRLPTQREMLLIWATKHKFPTGSAKFDPFVDGTYWTQTRTLNQLYVVDFQTGLAEIGSYFSNTNKFYYRCIREIP